jgi:glucose/arabinose dehydrogenase
MVPDSWARFSKHPKVRLAKLFAGQESPPGARFGVGAFRFDHGHVRSEYQATRRAKTAERWDVGQRIRDVEQGPDGSLWMLVDANPGALIHVTRK